MSRDAWWVEFLENEIEPSLRQDMEKLLRKSRRHQASLESLAQLRQWVEDSDPVEDLWDEEKVRKAQAKLLKAIAKQPPVKGRKQKREARAQDPKISTDFSGKRPGL
jgi:hypothetical protein